MSYNDNEIEIYIPQDVRGTTVKINGHDIPKLIGISVNAEVGSIPLVEIKVLGNVRIFGKPGTVRINKQELVSNE